jgi:hypothetical protein
MCAVVFAVDEGTRVADALVDAPAEVAIFARAKEGEELGFVVGDA